MPIDVQMPDGTIISGVPDNITQADLLARYKAFAPPTQPSGAVPDELGRYDAAKQNAPAGAGFSARDTALALSQGVVGAGKSLVDVFGADTAASRSLSDIQKDLSERYSSERQAEMARREAMQKQASKGTISEEISTFLGGVAEAPVQSLAQGLGSIVPYVGTGIIGGIAKLGGATVKAINTVVGAAQGAGAVKGSIYDGVKSELEKSGMSEQEAAAKAAKAQEYLGENFLDIIGSAALGGVGARIGVENLLTPGAGANLSKQFLARTGKAALAEAPLEGAQGGQEQLAINRALQKQGFDVGTFEGVAGAAARDAAVGAMTGATVGGVRSPSGEMIAPPAAVPPEAVPPAAISPDGRPVAPAESQDTQAMLDEFRNMGMPPAEPVAEAEVAAPVAAAEPDVPQTEEERNRAIEISNGMAATGYVNNILEKAQQGFIRAGQEYEETGSSPTMPRVVDFLRGQLRPLMGSEKADRYIQYLTEEGGLTFIENAVNSEYFGDAVNGVSKIVKPISIGTRPPAPPAQAPTAPAEPAATVEPMVETPTPDQPKMVEDETGEKLSYPMFVDMADKGYKLYSFENPRTYENKGGVRYRTLEKDGVRLALEPQQVLFTDPKKPNQQPQLGMGNENDVAFHFIGVDPDKRKQGKARQAIQDLIEIADKNNYTLYGEPAQLEKGGMTKDQLLNFYKQFGFKPTNDTNKVIVREPGAKPVETPVEKPKAAAGEPVASPENIIKPDPKWGKIKTGQSVTLPLYQGRGASADKIYSDVQVPIAGKGQYYAATGEDAAKYGDVKKYNITLENPLVITTDDEWKDLAKKKAGWQYVNPFGLEEKELKKITQDLKDTILAQGYDSLVIRPSGQGDDAKTLYRVFAHDQVVVYKEQEAQQSAPDVEVIANETTPELKDFDIAKSKETIHDEIKDLNAEELSQYLVDNAPNSAARHIADKILTRVKGLSKAGIPVKIEIRNGPIVYKDVEELKGNEQAATAYGWQQPILDETTRKLVYYSIALNGLDQNGKEHRSTGTNYQTIMHEMLHMVTSMQLHLMRERGFKGDKQVERDLTSVKRALVNKLIEERAKPLEERSSIVKRLEAALDVTGYKNGKPTFGPSSLDELISHGLTDKRLQRYLSTIEMGKKTALQELMAIFRKLVGIDPEYETALDRLILGANVLLDQKPSDINRMLKGFGYTAGKLKSAVKQNQTDTPQFKKWFGDSKVVNEDGSPKVVYHGTTEDFSVFNKTKDIGYHFGTAEQASNRVTENRFWNNEKIKDNANLMPVYLKADNLLRVPDMGQDWSSIPRILYNEGKLSKEKYNQWIEKGNASNGTTQVWKQLTRELLQDLGYDGIVYDNTKESSGGDSYIVFNPNQIKSAIGNTGEFDIESPDITKSTVAEEDKNKPTAQARNYLGKQIQANWAFPEDNVKHWPGLSSQSINDFLYKIQDKQIDTKNAQQAIEKAAGEIEENINVYEKEQLYHGRTATGIRKFLLDELMPAIKELGALKLTPQDLKDYLYNRHAPERNNKMNEVNKLDPITGKERKTPWELQDRASGISTKDARAYLANLEPAKKAALEKVAKRFDEMVQGTQQILLASGAEDQATIDAYNNTYKHYVPLFRIEDDFTKAGGIGATGSSKGFGVRGAFSKRAMGSEKEVQDILGNLIAQRERALIRAEKSKVGQALYGLALTNPNPDLWLPVNPDAIKSRDALVEELQDLGYKDAAQIADNLMEEPKSRYISKEKKQFVDPDTGLPMQVTEESVKLKLDNLKRFGDNVFPVRINGKDRYIFFNKNDPKALRMVHSLMNLDADSLGDIEGLIAKATRWFASVNTQYNPIFGVVNLIRDIGGSTLNLSTTAIAGDQAKVNKNVIPAMRGILNVLRDERKGKTDTKGKWAKAFQDFREQGGQTGYRDSLIRTDEEKQIIEREINKMKSGNTKKAFYAVVGALSDFNDMMENSIRVAAYMAALDKGLSKQKAAILAKNLTVNFDKKGQLSSRINAYFAFFNASVQGTARLAKTLKGPKGKAIIGGGIALGAAQAVILAMAGFDEDEPPEFVRERNFVVPLPDGKFLTIPYPLGFNVLPNVGRLTTEFVLSGGKDPGKKVTALLGSVVDAFSPIGGSELSLQTISPTVVDPMVAIATNKDAFGRPIYKKDQATNPTPGYLRSRENASEFSKNIAYFLNLASGGTKYSKGYLSPTGDELDYLIGQITGGVGRELIKAEQTVKSGITGEELPAYRIPLVGRFYGETQSNAAESQRFYNNIIKMADYENEVKGRIKNKEPVAEYLRENPQARFWQTANNVENQINALNKQKKEFIEKGLPKERIKRIENQKAVIMKRFNDQLAKYEE
jgi:GNAT superfamily N-acetyltransferase